MTVFREQFFSKTQLFRFSVELISRSTDPAATAVFKRPSSLQVLEPPSRIEPSNHGRQSSVEGMQALRNRVVGRDVCHLPLGGRRHRTVDDLMGVMVASIHRCCVVFWRVWGWVCKLHGCFNRTLSYLILYIYISESHNDNIPKVVFKISQIRRVGKFDNCDHSKMKRSNTKPWFFRVVNIGRFGWQGL